MTNCPFVLKSGVSNDMISDHFTVYAVRKKTRESKTVKKETVRDYCKFNNKVFSQLLVNSEWTHFDEELNPEKQWDIILEKVLEILSIMCPFKIVHTRVNKKKWINKDIYGFIRERKCLVKDYRRAGNPDTLNRMRLLRNRINSAVDKAKSVYIRNLLGATRRDQKKFWRNIKSLIDNDDIDVEHVRFKDPNDGDLVAQENVPDFLNSYFANISKRVCVPGQSRPFHTNLNSKANTVFAFSPPEQYEIMMHAENIDIYSSSGIDGINASICKCLIMEIPHKFRLLYANSMFIGYFPFKWTLSRVKLLPKTGDLGQPGNWRPISMTNIFSKVLEKLVHSQLLKYLLENDLLSNDQYGFLPGKLTHEAIFKIVRNIYSAINSRKLMGMLLLDIAKAFNCINHDILFLKMENAGFDPTVIQWFRSYLHRTQYVRIQNTDSNIMVVPDRIAQGTVLGPILFIFYINDVFKCTKYVRMSLFADDCVMYLSENSWQVIHRRMQRDFDAVIDWRYRNNLRLNHNKTKVIIFSTRHKIANLSQPTPFLVDGHAINLVKSHVYLGITLDNVMSLLPLVKSVKKRVSIRIFNLRKIRKYLTFDAAVAVYKQTILPIIDYAGFLLIAWNKDDIDELQVLQNDTLRICNRSKVADMISICDLHKKCKIISLKQRMQKQLLWLMYISSLDNNNHRVTVRNTRSANKIVLRCQQRLPPHMNIHHTI